MQLKTGAEVQVEIYPPFRFENQARIKGVKLLPPTNVNYRQGYSVSKVDDSDKYSRDAQTCVYYLAGGLSNENQPVSFLTHASPGVLTQYRSSFHHEMNLWLGELANQTENRFAILTGGYFGPSEVNTRGEYRTYRDEYLKMLNLFLKITRRKLGVDLYVPTLPKTSKGGTDVYFYTKEMRLEIFETGGNPQSRINLTAEQAKNDPALSYPFSERFSDAINAGLVGLGLK